LMQQWTNLHKDRGPPKPSRPPNASDAHEALTRVKEELAKVKSKSQEAEEALKEELARVKGELTDLKQQAIQAGEQIPVIQEFTSDDDRETQLIAEMPGKIAVESTEAMPGGRIAQEMRATKFTTKTVFRQVEEVEKDIEINDAGNERKSLKKNGFQKIRLPGQFTQELKKLRKETPTSMEDNEAFVNRLASIVGRLPFEGSLHYTEEEDEDGATLFRFFCYGGYLYDMPLLDGRGISLGGALRTAAHPGQLITKTEDGHQTQSAACQVHIDRNIDSPTLFPATFNDYLQHAYKKELSEKRINLTNIWVPLKNYSARPLAFADLESIDKQEHPQSSFDKPVSWDYFGTNAIEVLFPRHDECQKWFYYKDLKEGEEAVIFDTLRTPHVAVKNPNHADPEERHSIEIRCLSFTLRRKVLTEEEKPSEQLLKTFDVLQRITRYRYDTPPIKPNAMLANLRKQYRKLSENCNPAPVQMKYETEHTLALFDQDLRELHDKSRRQKMERLRNDQERRMQEEEEPPREKISIEFQQDYEDFNADIKEALARAEKRQSNGGDTQQNPNKPKGPNDPNGPKGADGPGGPPGPPGPPGGPDDFKGRAAADGLSGMKWLQLVLQQMEQQVEQVEQVSQERELSTPEICPITVAYKDDQRNYQQRTEPSEARTEPSEADIDEGRDRE